MSDKWIVKIKNKGYVSNEYFRNCESGRPIVKTRSKAVELDEDELGSDKLIHKIFLNLRCLGIKKKDITVCAADHRELFLQRTGWWDLFSTFR